MEVELFEDAVDQIGPFAVLVDPIECVMRGIHRQRRDVESLAVRRDGGDPGGDAEMNAAELAQLLHRSKDLMGASSLWVKDGFGIVEHYEYFVGG